MNARNVTVEDSYLFNTSLAALSSDVDLTSWMEGIATHNMTLRNSVVENCDDHMFIPANQPTATDGLRATISTNTQTKFGEARGGMVAITIVNNTIYKGTNWSCPVFRIASADDVLITCNKIFLGAIANAKSPTDPIPPLAVYCNARNVSIISNVVHFSEASQRAKWNDSAAVAEFGANCTPAWSSGIHSSWLVR